jgi:hypothetical protein
MPPRPPKFVVTDGVITSKLAGDAHLDPAKYFLQFSSPLVFCGREVGSFVNNVKVRKWTDTSGYAANKWAASDASPPKPEPSEPPQPAYGCLVNLGDISLTFTADPEDASSSPVPDKIESKDFRLYGTQTYRSDDGTVFLFTGEGKVGRTKFITGVGSCIEQLKPASLAADAAPRPKSWRFVFTIC